jgi:Ciliary protein causing Leber congenital amaurosis disease
VQVQESEIPALVERQAVEMHVLSERLQKHRESYHRKEKQLGDTEEELEKTRRLVEQLKGIVRDKQLEERRDLHKRLTKAEAALHEKDKAVRVSKL